MASSDYTSSMLPLTALVPQSVSAGGTATGVEIDTRGFRCAEFVITTGTVSATADGTINVQSATTSGGSFSTISGAVFTVAATDDDTQLRGFIDLDQMDRYLQLDVTGGTGGASLLGAVVILSGANNTSQQIDTGSGGDGEYAFRVLF